MKNKYKKFAGFTLIELLVTITIIGILSSISVSAFGNYQKKAYIAKQRQFKSEQRSLRQAECTVAQRENCFLRYILYAPYYTYNVRIASYPLVYSGGRLKSYPISYNNPSLQTRQMKEISSDGRNLLMIYPDGFYIQPLNGETLYKVANYSGSAAYLTATFSPDGKSLIYSSSGGVYKKLITENVNTLGAKIHQEQVRELKIAPDGRHLVWRRWNGYIYMKKLSDASGYGSKILGGVGNVYSFVIGVNQEYIYFSAGGKIWKKKIGSNPSNRGLAISSSFAYGGNGIFADEEGQWIYFSKGGTRIARVRTDGSFEETISESTPYSLQIISSF